MSTWEALIGDEHVELNNLRRDENFRLYVEDLPNQAEKKGLAIGSLNFDGLIRLQHLALETLDSPTISRSSGVRKTKELLADPAEFRDILDAHEKIFTDHCHGCGMTETEVADLEAGRLKAADFLKRRPGVILAPLLKQLVRRQ